jgi:hypothetical protein
MAAKHTSRRLAQMPNGLSQMGKYRFTFGIVQLFLTFVPPTFEPNIAKHALSPRRIN